MKTVFGDWFVERKSRHHPVEGEIVYFSVGEVVKLGDSTRYHVNSDAVFMNFEDALVWVKKQIKASDDTAV